MSDYIAAGALIDASGLYRYRLWRQWAHGMTAESRVLFIMLNPSTADGSTDDPTIRRCVGFARSWGYGGMEVVNLFAYRATDPAKLACAANPTGPGNDAEILFAASRAGLVVCAWGAHSAAGERAERAERVVDLLAASKIQAMCLGRTKAGHPKHPLYLRKDITPEVLS